MPVGLPGYPPQPGGDSRRGQKITVLVVAAVVLVAAIVGGVVLLNDDGADRAGPGPSATAKNPAPDDGDSGADGGGTEGTEPPPPGGDADVAPDVLNGITLPVPDGWQAGRNSEGGAGMTISPYPCPGDTASNCVRGGAYSMTAAGYQATTAEGVAKEDIAKNAENSYGKDPLAEKEMYGGITSHRQLRSQAVTVAGEKGYLVRWKVVTRTGDDGFVQSVVFPSPSGSKSLVVVRFGFDDSDKAPTLDDMDEIVEGIAPIGEPGAGGGPATRGTDGTTVSEGFGSEV
jgi:hypothetical protein